MAITPDTYDMTIQRSSDHSLDFELKDSTAAAVNLTGYTVQSQVWDSSRSSKAADVTITVTNASAGKFTWKLADTQTVNFTETEYKYDILLTTPSGDKQYWVEGTIYMSQGFTR